MNLPAPSVSDPLIDIDALVAPLDGQTGSGPDLRFDPAYRTIADARREENARLPQGVWAREVKHANWPLVERLCADLLRTRTKDLLVACWLAEAVVYRNGFGGLARRVAAADHAVPPLLAGPASGHRRRRPRTARRTVRVVEHKVPAAAARPADGTLRRPTPK